MKTWWDALAGRARATLLAGAAAIVLLLCAAAWWLLRGDPAVLFSELRPQDAAAMTAELDKLKVPYTIADGGATLLVDRSQVHGLRLKLMGRDLPLHGSVGLELFNTTDFGMTEFAQKVNYQRALQGELTRTILSFPEVRDARVHIALAEQGLFKQNAPRAKAAVTLTLRPGRSLRQEQVGGIQRLVAAAVPGLAAGEVTIVDQQGVALNRGVQEDAGAGSTRLDLKRDTENYLARKASAVLDQAFGPGQALASVDVTLNMDQVRVTTEDVLAAADAKGPATSGVLVRERETARDSGAPEARPGEARAVRGSSMQRDAEYQTGRRVEHMVSQPGAVRRIQVVAVVRQQLTPAQREEVQRLLAAAVGASLERGDTVVVQAQPPAAIPAPSGVAPVSVAEASAAPVHGIREAAVFEFLREGFGLLAMVLLVAALVIAVRERKAQVRPQPVLSPAQRQAALARVQSWLLQGEPVAVADVQVPGRPQ